MQFEIVGDITEVETFASGSGIREIARLRDGFMGVEDGASARALPRCD